MPQFLTMRYNETVALIMAIFWLFLYVFVNLTSILYLGALAINGLVGGESLHIVMIGLAIFAMVITLGGMKVIGYTDVIQVVVLIVGGLITTYLALTLLSEKSGMGSDVFSGFSILQDKASSHFHMIFDKGHPYYKDLPGLSVLVGGMWINNLNYWGCNQYIVQRALGADLKTARQGILFAAFLKLLIPVIAVIPGIAMYVLHHEGLFHSEMQNELGVLKPDHAYPTLMNLLPAGSVTGAPKAKTVQIIREAEEEQRGYYSGVFGYFDGDQLDSAVMIRFIEKTGNKFFYRSGGGITTQSKAEIEYQEAIDKIYVPVN